MSALSDAIKKGKFDVVKSLLADDGVDPAEDNHIAFRTAIDWNQAKIVELLLAHNLVDPCARDNYAIRFAKDPEIIKFLLRDKRVDPTAGQNHAIRYAAEKGRLEVVKILLADKRIDPSALDNYALNLAIQRGHKAIVEVLLEDNSVRNSIDINFLEIALNSGNVDIVKLILEKTNLKLESIDISFLETALNNGNAGIVKLILEKTNFTLNDVYSDIRTHIENGHVEMVKMLMNHPDVNIEEDDIYQGICDAIQKGHVQMIDYFLKETSIDINFYNNFAISLAANLGQTKIVELLLGDNRVVVPETAFIEATKRGHKDIAKMLSEHIDLTKNNYGSITLIVQNGYTEIFNLSAEKQLSVLDSAFPQQNKIVIDAFIDFIVDPNNKDNNQKSQFVEKILAHDWIMSENKIVQLYQHFGVVALAKATNSWVKMLNLLAIVPENILGTDKKLLMQMIQENIQEALNKGIGPDDFKNVFKFTQLDESKIKKMLEALFSSPVLTKTQTDIILNNLLNYIFNNYAMAAATRLYNIINASLPSDEQKKIVGNKKIAAYYKEVLSELSTLTFSHQVLNDSKLKDDTLGAFKVVYNNESYDMLNFSPTGLSHFIPGDPLYLDDTKQTPIGYNIHIPETKINNVVVHIYGGNTKKDIYDKAFKPGKLDELEKNLLAQGTVIVKLNLPDLLKSENTQSKMTREMFLEIQACIHKFYEQLTTKPALLHPSLAEFNFDKLGIFLLGASFGGAMALRHAQLYPGTYTGYISHDGAISAEMAKKSDKLDRHGSEPWLDPGNPIEIQKIVDQLLLLHNFDDNNVSVKDTLHFFEELQKMNKAHLAKLHISAKGNPAPVEGIHNKGHYYPTDEAGFSDYVASVANFLKLNRALPNVSVWQADIQDKLANLYYKSATTKERVLARLLQEERLRTNFTQNAWKQHFNETYYAFYYANEMANDESKLALEVERLRSNNLLNDEVLANALKFQSQTTMQHMKERYNIELPENFYSNADMIAVFRESLTSNNPNPALTSYLLTSLYQANPSLLKPLYQQFDESAEIKKDRKETKKSVEQTYSRERRAVTTVWKDTLKAVQNERIKNINKISNIINHIENNVDNLEGFKEIINLSKDYLDDRIKLKVILSLNELIKKLEKENPSQITNSNIIYAKLTQAIIIDSDKNTQSVLNEMIQFHGKNREESDNQRDPLKSRDYVEMQFKRLSNNLHKKRKRIE